MNVNKSHEATITKAANPNYDASFVMSAASPDRVKDTIDPKAYAPNLGRKLIALFQHNSEQPIGYWENLRVESKQLLGDIKFATTQLAQMVKTLINDGVPLGASIGFRGQGEQNKEGGIEFKAIELLECSVVSVPCHPAAMQIAKNYGFDLNALVKPEQLLSKAQTIALARAAAAVNKVEGMKS
jgi:HK97 family phage prohead protease